jgi:hypothetical protein
MNSFLDYFYSRKAVLRGGGSVFFDDKELISARSRTKCPFCGSQEWYRYTRYLTIFDEKTDHMVDTDIVVPSSGYMLEFALPLIDVGGSSFKHNPETYQIDECCECGAVIA